MKRWWVRDFGARKMDLVFWIFMSYVSIYIYIFLKKNIGGFLLLWVFFFLFYFFSLFFFSWILGIVNRWWNFGNLGLERWIWHSWFFTFYVCFLDFGIVKRWWNFGVKEMDLVFLMLTNKFGGEVLGCKC